MRYLKTLLALCLAILLTSCSKENSKDGSEPLLEVNYYNISGSWSLEMLNGKPLLDGTFMELKLERSEHTFEISTNLDSFQNVPHTMSGTYALSVSAQDGAVIEGKYDHDSGFWSHDYVIERLGANSMLWVALDDPDLTQLFKRTE
ncbi:MAG: hypothetical protein ACI4TL_00730 [Candidatus Cryptobacteroides sp.]